MIQTYCALVYQRRVQLWKLSIDGSFHTSVALISEARVQTRTTRWCEACLAFVGGKKKSRKQQTLARHFLRLTYQLEDTPKAWLPHWIHRCGDCILCMYLYFFKHLVPIKLIFVFTPRLSTSNRGFRFIQSGVYLLIGRAINGRA